MLDAEDFNDDKKDAGEIGAGHTVTALYEIVPKGTPARQRRCGPAQVPGEGATVRGRSERRAHDGEAALQGALWRQEQGAPHRRARDLGGRSEGPTNLGFASAVAEFGLLLFDSKYKGDASYEQVLDLARANRGDDIHGYRGEFVRLVELAKELAGKH